MKRMVITGGLAATLASVQAADWQITPSIELTQTYTDNLFLAPEGEEVDDWVTEVSPGLRVLAQGNRLDLDFSATLQQYFYQEHDIDEDDARFEQFRLRSTAELVDEFIYVDAMGYRAQRSASNVQRQSADNLNPIKNRADLNVWTVSPYLHRNFKNWAEVELRYRYTETDYDAPQDLELPENIGNTFRSSINEGIEFSAVNGSRFAQSFWQIEYSRRIAKQEGASREATQDEAFIYAGHYLNEEWAVITQIGYEDHDLFSSFNDGTYYSAGVLWQPELWFKLQVLAGSRNKEVSVTWLPTSRTNINLTWRERDVGIIDGPTWSLSAQHTLRDGQIFATYTEEVTFFDGFDPVFQEFVLADEDGNLILDDQGAPIIDVFLVGAIPVEREYRREYAQAGYNFARGKLSVVGAGYISRRYDVNTDREFEAVQGGSFSLRWNLNRSLRWYFTYRDQFADYEQSGFDSHLQIAELGMTKQLSRDTHVGISVMGAVQETRDDLFDYQEGRASLTFRHEF